MAEALCINWLTSPADRQAGTLKPKCPITCPFNPLSEQLVNQNNWTRPDVETIDQFFADPDPISQGAAAVAQNGITGSVGAFIRTYNKLQMQPVSTNECEQLPQ